MGATDDPKNIVRALYKAFSAATLTSLGADTILMGRKGELGPIDPQILEKPKEPTPNVMPMSTEDVSSYVSFIKETVGITDQNALAVLTKSLTDTLPPPTLGQVNRIHSHVRAVARKMLSLSRPAFAPAQIQEVIESLTERTFIHGHSIGRSEAKQFGLHIQDMDESLERLCWDLYLQYEADLKLHSFANPVAYFDDDGKDEYVENNAILSCIESVAKCHEYSGPFKIQKIRQVQPQLQLEINAPIQLPDTITLDSITPQLQQLLQELQQNTISQVKGVVAAELARRMPVVRTTMQNEKMLWNLLPDG